MSASFSSRARVKPVPPCCSEIVRAMEAVSASERCVGPWNLKNRLSSSGHLGVDLGDREKNERVEDSGEEGGGREDP